MARDQLISVVASDREKSIAARAAKLAGESVSTFCRRAMLARARDVAEMLTEEEASDAVRTE